MGKTLFIADTHFGHKNILAYDNRPFKDTEENDRVLTQLWNEAVEYDDTVWILGDVSWHPVTKTIEILKELNGNKNLIIGNHDHRFLKNKDFRNQFMWIGDYKELVLDDDSGVVLSHYPIPTYNHHFRGWYHLYGHVHTSFEYNMIQRFEYEMKELYNKPSRMFNIGCMVPQMEYTPKTLSEIIKAYGGE